MSTKLIDNHLSDYKSFLCIFWIASILLAQEADKDVGDPTLIITYD